MVLPWNCCSCRRHCRGCSRGGDPGWCQWIPGILRASCIVCWVVSNRYRNVSVLNLSWTQPGELSSTDFHRVLSPLVQSTELCGWIISDRIVRKSVPTEDLFKCDGSISFNSDLLYHFIITYGINSDIIMRKSVSTEGLFQYVCSTSSNSDLDNYIWN